MSTTTTMQPTRKVSTSTSQFASDHDFVAMNNPALFSAGASGTDATSIRATWGSLQLTTIYDQTLADLFQPHNRIINSALPIAEQVTDETVRSTALRLIHTIQSMADMISEKQHVKSFLPILSAFEYEDGSLLIEWHFSDFRIGFSIDPNPDESGWFLIGGESFGFTNASGHLPQGETGELIVFWVAMFVFLTRD